MKNRIINKMLIIGIILLITAIPIVGSYPILKNTSRASIETPENYLGEIKIRHSTPWNDIRILIPTFHPVPEGEYRHYNFTEIDGKVLMNFTVNLSHILKIPMILERTSQWEIYVRDPVEERDYIQNITRKKCTSTDWETFTIHLVADKLLVTNNETKTLEVLFYTRGWVLGIIPTILYGKHSWMKCEIIPRILSPNSWFNIYIHPIPQ